MFRCDKCDHLVHFENTCCVKCGCVLAFVPDRTEMVALERVDEGGDVWRLADQKRPEPGYRLCQNYVTENVCNWAVSVDDPNPYCASCRLTRIIPNLSRPGARDFWARLEAAKRRLMYSLLRLRLPIVSKTVDPQAGLAFEFLADPDPGSGASPVMTGHAHGVITINIAEADDAERERRRHDLGEPYRTLLGHFRHEIGHYYWDRLIRDKEWIDEFRDLFGDERKDYAQALKDYHDQGARADWSSEFVSAYASAHPWEDWAESWAHYLHMTETLETAVESGLTLRPRRSDEPAMKPNVTVVGRRPSPFDELIDRWFPLTYVLNNLNRGMGLPDAYPFVLSPPAVEKLRFIHQLIG